jgi:hypothetical protein
VWKAKVIFVRFTEQKRLGGAGRTIQNLFATFATQIHTMTATGNFSK